MKKIWFKIKAFFGFIFLKFRRVIKKNVEPAIKVVNILKDIIESPAVSVGVALTPFAWDDNLVKLAKSALPKALLALQILKDTIGKSNEEMVKAIVDEVRKYTPDAKAKFYEDLATMLAHDLSDGELSIAELSDLVKFVYEQKFKKK